MSKRARLSGRLEYWMVASESAADQGAWPGLGESIEAVPAPRLVAPVAKDTAPDEASQMCGDEG